MDFDEPQYAVAPGQAVVFYDGDVFWVGAGSTDRARPACGAPTGGALGASGVHFGFAKVLRHAFQVFLGVDRGHTS